MYVMALTYKDSGVNIDEGNRLVEAIKPLAKATSRREVMGGIGGFGAVFDIMKSGYKNPVLVSSTDGVGTKLKIAFEANLHKGIGIDLVAMSVNDILVQGAEPLFFLDYFATGKLSSKTAAEVIASIAEGCTQAGCALVGGETAEMPGMYADGEYDLAGFAVGAVEKDELLPRADLQKGDVVLGLASSGLHSNGYSLVRKIVAANKLKYNEPAPFDKSLTMAEALLTPTRIYVKALLPLVRAGKIKAMAHITGGGLAENIPRVLPEGLAVRLDEKSWEKPKVFGWLESLGAVEKIEMHRTLNCGIGMVVVIDAIRKSEVMKALTESGEKCFEIGEIIARSGEAVEFT